MGSIAGVNGATASTSVGIGTTAPSAGFHLSGAGIVRARVNSDSNAGLSLALNEQSNWSLANTSPGHFQLYNDRIGQQALWVSTFDNSLNVGAFNASGIATLAALGNAGATALCRNASNQISICSSSLRYKTNVADFRAGLDLIRLLRPVAFNWRADNRPDFGLVAEEVASVEPLLTVYDEKGAVEGVKYDRVGVVLINAVNEQQAEIEAQRREIERLRETVERQRAQIEDLKSLFCAAFSTAPVCRKKEER